MASLRTVTTMTGRAEDLPAIEEIFQVFIDHVRANEPGVLSYHYFVDDDPFLIHVIEEYADPDVMVQHFSNLPGEEIGRLLQMVQLGSVDFYGEATPVVRETLAPFGAVSYHRPLRSI